jgi:hypothetical protein
MDLEQAKQIENAVRTLEQLQDRSPAEERALQRGREMLGQAQQTQAQYDSRYRGAARGATLGLKDELAGVAGLVTGEGYGPARDASLKKDQAASILDPEGFQTGQNAGQIGTAAMTSLFAPALTGTSMLTKMGAGALAGGGMGALAGESDYEMDGSPEGQRWDYLKGPTLVGAVTGGAVYPMGQVASALGKGIRNTVREGVEGFGRMPTRTMSRAVGNTQDSMDIRKYLDGLTDEAMLADVPGEVQSRAQGLAVIGGPGGQRVRDAVTSRAEGAGARIEADMTANIDEPNAAFAQRQALAKERSTVWGPEYDAALSAEGAVEVGPAVRQLEEARRVAGPDTAPVLDKFISDLKTKGQNGLIDPAQLHWIRSDLREAIDGTPTKRNALLQSALKSVDEVLDTVPGYADARTGYANTFAMDRAIDAGAEALRGGRASALSPAELAQQFGKLSDAEKDAFRVGLRRDVAALMGTSRNDAAAAWGEFSKGWNEEKLRIVLGNAADPIIKRLRSEQAFSQTRGRVDAGSQTQFRSEAAEDLGDYREQETGRAPGPIVRAKRGLDDAGNSVVDALLYGSRRTNANDELGRMLTMTGPDQRKLLAALIGDAQKNQLPLQNSRAVEAVARALTAGGITAQAN